MNKFVIARHFINNEETLTEFSEQTSKILSSMDLLERNNINFGIKLTVDSLNLTEDLEKGLLKKKQDYQNVYGSCMILKTKARE